jgi:excisionase family DNA binding protein
MISVKKTLEPAVPSEEECSLARESGRRLARLKKGDLEIRIPKLRGKVTLPASAVRMLVALLSEMASGKAVAVTPVHAELTTQQAADLLGVSRPFLIKQTQQGRIPFRKVGAHRRILFEDVMAYKRGVDGRRLKTLEALSAQAQKLNMGY